MNYHQPRQVDPTADRPDAGKWLYTNMNIRVWPEGYCAEGCDGHDTKEGAYAHQTQYVLDKMRLDGQYADVQRRCIKEDCGVWTDRFAEVEMRTFDLCDEHRTRKVVTELYGSVGDSYGSW